jgi:hypothetical protein
MFILSLISIVVITGVLVVIGVHPLLATGGGIVITMIWWWFAYRKLYGPR